MAARALWVKGCTFKSWVPRPPKNANFWVLLHFYVTIFEIMGCTCRAPCAPPLTPPLVVRVHNRKFVEKKVFIASFSRKIRENGFDGKTCFHRRFVKLTLKKKCLYCIVFTENSRKRIWWNDLFSQKIREIDFEKKSIYSIVFTENSREWIWWKGLFSQKICEIK